MRGHLIGTERTTPTALFGILCTPETDKVIVSFGFDAFWRSCTSGSKAEELAKFTKEHLDRQETQEIGAQRTLQEARNFQDEMATQTSCAILQGILNQQEPVAETLFQINHVRVCEPGCGENIKTNSGERLFVPVRRIDFTGVVNLRMCEQAALELSGCSSVEKFVTACQDSDLRFPLLASVRVHLRPKSSDPPEHSASSQSDPQGTQATTEIQAIIVEAAPQLWDAANTPNASVMELSTFLTHLPTPASRMVANNLAQGTEPSRKTSLTAVFGTVAQIPLCQLTAFPSAPWTIS